MQLIALAIYNSTGDRRDVVFHPGKLNIVTGESATGKSALLDMVEYCLGRDTIMMPVGPITSTVVWYAALFQMPGGGRAFVARPAPRLGAASTQQAMLELGADLELFPFEGLAVNCDTAALREQLGRRIGIEENLTDPGELSMRSPLEAHLGHAVLLCLQRQDEIANRNHLFHRQGEAGMQQTLKDTLPYFLGAAPRDEAIKRLKLREARRELSRLQGQISSVEASAESIEGELNALAAEAAAVGLIDPIVEGADRALIAATLEDVARRPGSTPDSADQSGPDVDARLALEQRRRMLRDELHVVGAERFLLLDAAAEETSYGQAVSSQASRLSSLELLTSPEAEDNDSDHCPLCLSELEEPDPSVEDLHTSLVGLRSQLTGLEAARPTRRSALAKLDDRGRMLREDLRVIEAALRALLEGDDAVDPAAESERREFTRGRISATLAVMRRVDESEVERLRRNAEQVQRRLDALASDLDDDEARMRLDSCLLELASEMTDLAQRLSLEHSSSMRLDLGRLTVVTETDEGPAPLWRVGSAENWIGAHLVTHLALHKFFRDGDRPVPRFLMLDQPTQAFYPSEMDGWDGVPIEDADGEAVRGIFQLLLDVVTELDSKFQIIVCDHANLPETWFQNAVVHDWRRGDKLIPTDWLEEPTTDNAGSSGSS